MGYNGGINKRGYYKRGHGMYSKAADKSVEKILTNIILVGLGLLKIGVRTSADIADKLQTNIDTKTKHFSPKQQRTKIYIWGIIALLCPIGGFLAFTYADWWMFFCVIVFGCFETFAIEHISQRERSSWHDKDYIYEEEIKSVQTECKTNRKILIALYISLFILNLYPIALYILDSIDIFNTIYIPINTWNGGETALPFIIVILKLALNAFFIIDIFHDNIKVETYKVIRKQERTKTNITNTSKAEIYSSTLSDDSIHQKESTDEPPTIVSNY